MDVPNIEQVKIQARVLVPLIKAMQAELGAARADSLVRKALGDHYRALGEKGCSARADERVLGSKACGVERFAAGGALDYTVLEQTSDSFDADVTGCRYAQFYRAIGAPELGFLLVCNSDFSMADGYGSDVRLTRSQTIMEGASHCDFRYSRPASQTS